MAKFGENILEFKDVLELNRMPVTCNGNQWFIMIGKSSVISVQDSKTLHTWTLVQRHQHYFSSPIAYFDTRLYCVMDRKVLIRWSLEDDNLENAEKVEMKQPVRTILSLNEQQPLVIFESGRFAVIDDKAFSDVKPCDLFSLKASENLQWVDATVSATKIALFYLTYNEQMENYTLYYIMVNKKNILESAVQSYEIKHGKTSLKSCCINQDLSFFSLWSNGEIRCFNMETLKDVVLFSIQDNSSIVNMNCVDSNHIVMAKGKPTYSECTLEIWDAKNAIQKGKKEFKTASLDSLQVVAVNGYILLNHSKLIAVPFSLDSTLLSAMNTTVEVEVIDSAWDMDVKTKEISLSDEMEDINETSLPAKSKITAELIMERLLKGDSFDLLDPIPESEIIKMLQIIICCKEAEVKTEKFSEEHMYIILNFIFSSSCNDALLMKNLRRLSFEDALVTLNFLLSYLNYTKNIPSHPRKRPSDLQIVNWISVITDSHMEALLFTKEKTKKDLLKDLSKALCEKMEEYEDFEELQIYLSILDKKDMLPQHHSVEKYTLETLDL